MYLTANSADPDQLDHCFQRQGLSGFSRTRVKGLQYLQPLGEGSMLVFLLAGLCGSVGCASD